MKANGALSADQDKGLEEIRAERGSGIRSLNFRVPRLWLRREKRSTQARDHLSIAYDFFDTMGAASFAGHSSLIELPVALIELYAVFFWIGGLVNTILYRDANLATPAAAK